MSLFSNTVHTRTKHTHTNTNTLVPYTKNVIEKKAPTDESIAFFKELETKAYESVVKTLDVKAGFFDVKAVLFMSSCSGGRLTFMFNINGEEIICHEELNFQDMLLFRTFTLDGQKEKLSSMIRKRVEKVIFEKIVTSIEFKDTINKMIL